MDGVIRRLCVIGEIFEERLTDETASGTFCKRKNQSGMNRVDRNTPYFYIFR